MAGGPGTRWRASCHIFKVVGALAADGLSKSPGSEIEIPCSAQFSLAHAVLPTFAKEGAQASSPVIGVAASLPGKTSAASAPSEDPYGLDDNGYVDRSVSVIVIGQILERM